MAETEFETKMEKQIRLLQQQLNRQEVYLKRLHGEITHPTVLARVKQYTDVQFTDISGKFGAWTDYSTTSTIVGWSAFTTKVLIYKKIDDMVFVHVHIDGTSNSTAVTFTLPLASLAAWNIKCLHAMDNAQWRAVNGVVSLAVSNVATCSLDGDATAWTNSGRKIIQGQFFYRVA